MVGASADTKAEAAQLRGYAAAQARDAIDASLQMGSAPAVSAKSAVKSTSGFNASGGGGSTSGGGGGGSGGGVGGDGSPTMKQVWNQISGSSSGQPPAAAAAGAAAGAAAAAAPPASPATPVSGLTTGLSQSLLASNLRRIDSGLLCNMEKTAGEGGSGAGARSSRSEVITERRLTPDDFEMLCLVGRAALSSTSRLKTPNHFWRDTPSGSSDETTQVEPRYLRVHRPWWWVRARSGRCSRQGLTLAHISPHPKPFWSVSRFVSSL